MQGAPGPGFRTSTIIRVIDVAVFYCLAACALVAPLSTKGAVNAFRAALVLWLAAVVWEKRRLLPQQLGYPLLAFLGLTGLSSAFSTDPFLSWGRMRTIELFVLAILIGQVVRTVRQVKILVGLLVGSCVLTVLYTGWQYTAGIGVRAVGPPAIATALQRFGLGPADIIDQADGRRIRSGPELLQGLGLAGARNIPIRVQRETPNGLQAISVNVPSKSLARVLQSPGVALVRAHPPRAQGFFRHYFPYSELLVLVALLCWGLALCGSGHSLYRLSLFGAFFAIAAAIVLTLTRVSFVSLVAGTLIISLTRLSRRTMWVNLVALGLIAAGTLFWIQRYRAISLDTSDPGTQYRLQIWRDSLPLIRAHPLLGVGLDSVAGDWQRWNLAAYRRFPLHSHFHSTPIQIAVECGLPALVAWIWLIAAYFVFLVKVNKSTAADDWFSKGLILGVLGGLIAFVLTGFLQYNLGDAEAMVVFCLCMGLAFAMARKVDVSPQTQTQGLVN